MCGINGVVSKQLNINMEEILGKMNDKIIHRGPDDDGMYSYTKENTHVGIGMRRLSIIDVGFGSQPIFSEDKSLIIVFNGEIYNYKVLKNHLVTQFDAKFNTLSDTEVILNLYERYGIKSFGMLDGMFAFSIIDKNKNKIYIARDFFGEKPLYYTKDKDSILWSSELKSITKVMQKKREISKKALSLYFQLTYIPAPYSIYEDVFKLKPNNFIEIDLCSLDFKISPIKQNKSKKDYSKIDFNTAKKINHDLVVKSVESRSISDVPIGTFLSGGVDSSIVSLALSQYAPSPIDTFSMGFDKKTFDETDKSRVIAKLIGSNHHEFIVTANDLKYDIDTVLLNFDEPFADSSALPTYLVSKLTQQHVKVALTGDGGDEVFGGYNKYYIGKINNKYKSIVPENTHKLFLNTAYKIFNTKDDDRGIRFKINRLLKAIDYDNDFYYNIVSLGFQKNELSNLIKPDVLKENSLDYYKKDDCSRLRDFRNIDKYLSLEGDMLVKVDRTSMLSSIECRAPFLNKEIWDFTNQLPDSYLMKGWRKKHLLKESFKQYFPEGFLNKSKQGFGVPVGDWLRSILKDELKSYIEYKFLTDQGLFNIDFARKIVLDHLEGKVDNTFRVWTYYCFQKWYSNRHK
jgi:asparagine synthase (glutamine-hydrolysing)